LGLLGEELGQAADSEGYEWSQGDQAAGRVVVCQSPQFRQTHAQGRPRGADRIQVDDGRTAVLRRDLVKVLVEQDELSDLALRAAFEEVPRHVFVPAYFINNLQTKISRDQPDQYEIWLSDVYDDKPLPTHVINGMVVSSSSQPSLMAAMLQALELEGHERVLEVGTGTGYNAALLSHRLGDDRVVTIDVDPGLSALANKHLHETGYRPLVVVGNGMAGYAAQAPYERIVVTVGINRISQHWLDQLSDAGTILAPLGVGLVRIRKDGMGRFLSTPAFFLPVRGTEIRYQPEIPDGKARPSELFGEILQDSDFLFLISLLLPRLTWQYEIDEEGKETGAATVWSADGSIADLRKDGKVVESGPQLIWSELESAHRIFVKYGRPSRQRYGLSIAGRTHEVWLDDPSGPSWILNT
jgi:protein-L-isoaspartate(D-aspartate) O-methyltransferase